MTELKRNRSLRVLAVQVLCGGLLAGAAWLPAAHAGDAAAGAAAWVQEHPQPNGAPARSCATCHTDDLTQPGRHAKTGKPIEPMAPSVNPERLSDQAKVEKWLRRNCRWTLGRECTAAEKADFLTYIKSQ
ncbi:MAG: DUF1924 domain-containing protein [Thiohalocapsa sp.]|jgi:hypothetical protein|uniref:DUF1924 domain-containing protein n=1 Tax=Thiohalocapsa sp. TaxID=2497641 RepID=UPI0025F82EF5|nr:DUF1924 domain-containing protein [Thiohalocapsa sp.]MCG6941703.1 DUF1924 domain-containing protein [Thiohalocapsa sp.]